jgi:hypothetical protein
MKSSMRSMKKRMIMIGTVLPVLGLNSGPHTCCPRWAVPPVLMLLVCSSDRVSCPAGVGLKSSHLCLSSGWNHRHAYHGQPWKSLFFKVCFIINYILLILLGLKHLWEDLWIGQDGRCQITNSLLSQQFKCKWGIRSWATKGLHILQNI